MQTSAMMASEPEIRQGYDDPGNNGERASPGGEAQWRGQKAGSSAGMSVEGLTSMARSSLAIQIAQTSHATNFTVALFFLLLPLTDFSIARERQ